ncbi:ASCH domain-containing protein [bacterium]|nr:MAG: ASCH domain-containing protein [bacterium]
MVTPNKSQVEAFINRFRQANPSDDPQIATRKIDTDYFGDSPKMADELLVPILEGKKTATCGALWEWEHEKETPLEPGYLAAIIDGSGNARCIIETVSVVLTPYNEVDAKFAFDEGEGDRTLEHWRKVHWEFFSRTLPRIGKEPSQDMPLLCERFRVIYREETC